MSDKKTAATEGWGFPSNSKMAHYFRDGRSLCSKWGFWGALETGNDESADNCVACRRKLGHAIAANPLAKRCTYCAARAGAKCFGGCENVARQR